MLSSCALLAFPNTPCMLLFYIPGFAGGDPVEPAHPSTQLSRSPSRLICRSRPRELGSCFNAFCSTTQQRTMYSLKHGANKKSIKMGLAELVGWGYYGCLPATAFVVVAFSQIKLCESNLNIFSSVLPSPSIHQRMPFATCLYSHPVQTVAVVEAGSHWSNG